MNKKTLQLLKAEEEIRLELKDSWNSMKKLEFELDFLVSKEPEKLRRIKQLEESIKCLYKHIEYLEYLNETN